MEWWNSGTVEWWNSEIVEQWNGGIVEQWNGGIVEQWNGGIVEQWNSGTVEWWNRFFFSSILFACLSTNYYSMAYFSVCLLLFQAILFFTQIVRFLCFFVFLHFSIGNISRHSVDKNSSETFRHVFYQVQVGNSCMEVVVQYFSPQWMWQLGTGQSWTS